MMSEIIVGIDLGTTNSEVAAFHNGEVRVLGPGDKRILPSCVGFSASGELLVGDAARNQQALYPERTVHSIKRRMGLPGEASLGDRSRLPKSPLSSLANSLNGRRSLWENVRRRLSSPSPLISPTPSATLPAKPARWLVSKLSAS